MLLLVKIRSWYLKQQLLDKVSLTIVHLQLHKQNMEHEKWELIVNKLLKFTGSDPQMHTVEIAPTANFPLKNESKRHNCVLSARYRVYLPFILNYNVRPDDIWIITYPRSGMLFQAFKFLVEIYCCRNFIGTTWTQEMVWLINNDYDFQMAKNISLLTRSPTLRNL